jgi:glycine oxidase
MPAQGGGEAPAPAEVVIVMPVPNRAKDSSRGSFDAIVVGAGVIGLACAWRASQRGLRVCVVDRDRPGSGASRVAAGMLAPVGEASWDEERLLELNLRSARAYPEFAAELERESGRTVGYRRCGALHVALDRDEAEELGRRYELQRSLGLDAEWLRRSACRELEPGLSTAVTAGVHVPGDGEVDPRRLLAALVGALAHATATLITGVEVTEAIVDGDRVAGVRLDNGRELGADVVVVATGAWSGEASWLPAAARPQVRPVKGQVVRLAGPSERPLCERIVASERVYVVPRADGEVVVGATVEERGFETTVTAGGVHELLREGYRALPDVAELELVEASAGLRPGTPDNAPVIGLGALDGLVLATGHYRNGILLAPATADAVAELLAPASRAAKREGVAAR